MKKFFKTKFIIALAIFSLFVGSMHVYATTGLDAYALTLIKVIFDLKQTEFDEQINLGTRGFVENSKSEIDSYLDIASANIISNVENFTADQIKRADVELNDYTADLIQQLEEVMQAEENRLKGLVSERVDQYIDQMKQELFIELNNELNERILNKLQ